MTTLLCTAGTADLTPLRSAEHLPEVARHEFVLTCEQGQFGAATPDAYTLALLAVVLYRQTDQTSLTVSSRSLRTHGEERQEVVGIDLADAPRFSTLVGRLHAALAGVERGTHLAGAANRGESGDPVVAIRHRFGEDALGDVLAPLPYEQQAQHLELDVHFRQADGAIAGVITYDSRLFAPEYIAQLAAQMGAAMADAAANPDQLVTVLHLVGAAEREVLLRWGGQGVPVEEPRCIHELFADEVRRRPNAIALSCQGEQMSYQELNDRAERFADWLAEAGVGPDRVVALLYARRTMELYVALVGILKAGGCYLAIHPDTPSSRIQYMLADAAPLLLLSQDAQQAELLATPIPIVTLARAVEASKGAKPRRVAAVRPDNLAYISYTSGSTGIPKGACIPHSAVARLVRKSDWAAFGPDDVFLQLSPIPFDASVLEIWMPLTNGGRLAIYGPTAVVADELAQTLQMERVTTAWLSAGFFHLMVDTQIEAFRGLRHVLAGGDSISRVHLERLFAVHPHLLFTNGYGPTENTTFTTCWTTTQPVRHGSVPIGRPVSGTWVAILDSEGQLVPIGVQGELHTGGAGLARCYLNQPEVTDEKFIPAPPPHPAGTRMYRTGDLARWRHDGTIEFLGRADFQVKIQGFRVELGEIEAALARDPQVRNAVVVTQAGALGQKHLLAYIVPVEAEADQAELVREARARLKRELPPYMIPWAILTLPAIPLTKNGKVDRAALPAATRAPRSLETEYTAPRNRTESALADLWGRMLGIEPIGIDDDFFELGGHSLMAAELARQIQRGIGVTVPGRTLYLEPTIAGLASAIEEISKRNASAQSSRGGGGNT
jgi:amino acid adenylation domain-containing protein